MKKYVLSATSFFFFFLSCRQNTGTAQEDFFPVLPFIQNDVADVDTSFYPVKKIVWVDSLGPDTTFVKREDFRGLANEFLQLPDLSKKKYKKLFTEEKFFDQTLNTVIITYRPNNPEKEDIQRQEILITPEPGNNKVKTLIIDRITAFKDSTVQKRMLWQIGKSFQVITIIQKTTIRRKKLYIESCLERS